MSGRTRREHAAPRGRHHGPCRRAGAGRRHQRGAALVVALVLVLVATLLGVSAVRTSNVEAMLVANEGFRQSAFRAAEAAVESELPNVDAGALVSDAPETLSVTSVDARVNVAAEARFEGIGPVLNFSYGLFQNRLYAVSATATIDGVGARRTVVQGAARRAPLNR